MYIIEEITKTPEVPYGDTFQTVTRYCITWKSKDSCQLLITCGIDWLKNPLVKGLIKGAAMKGVSETSKAILEIVVNELLPQRKAIINEKLSEKKSEIYRPRIISIQYNHLALLIGLIIILLTFNLYIWHQIKSQPSACEPCISQFSLNRWISSDACSQDSKSNFVKSYFTNGTLNTGVEFKSVELEKNYKKYTEYALTSMKMASDLTNDWILLNQIYSNSIEALYQNWIIGNLYNIDSS